MNWLAGMFGRKRVRHIAYTPAHDLVLVTSGLRRMPALSLVAALPGGVVITVRLDHLSCN